VATNRSGDGERGRSASGLLAFCGALIAILPPLLLVAALVGLAQARGVPGPLALLCGIVLAIVPVAGLARHRGGPRLVRIGIAAWLWSLALLAAIPLYFPGERESATESGLRWLFGSAGEPAAHALAEAGAGLTALLGDDPEPAARQTRISSGIVGKERTTALAAPAARPAPRDQAVAPTDEELLVTLPYEGDERSLRIKVDVDGPHLGEQIEMVFDTGATFTTLDEATVDALGIDWPADAPRVTLQTANGKIDAPLVLVDAFWLGDEVVEWVTVAVCDSCTSPPAAGLLGLNVSRQFHVSLDYDQKRIELRGRRRVRDRQLDVGQWLEIRAEARRHWNGAVNVAVTGRNRARQAVETAVVEVDCGGEGFAVQLDRIPARGERQTEFALPRGTDCRQLRVGLARAQWLLDRF
jgi:clan AA aspartic protease (TIGR02281 family)